MAQIVAEAFYIAQNGRPGPVLIDIPKDVGLKNLRIIHLFIKKILLNKKVIVFNIKRNVGKKQALKMIKQASQPYFMLGEVLLLQMQLMNS